MKLPRMSVSLVITVVLAVLVALLAPQQLPVTLYKLSLVSAAGVTGYWLDRELFPYARPDSFFGGADLYSSTRTAAFAACMQRRALIVGCAMLAVGLGA